MVIYSILKTMKLTNQNGRTKYLHKVVIYFNNWSTSEVLLQVYETAVFQCFYT